MHFECITVVTEGGILTGCLLGRLPFQLILTPSCIHDSLFVEEQRKKNLVQHRLVDLSKSL